MSDVKTDKSERHRHKTNVNLEENNPCLKEHKASLNCLDKSERHRHKTNVNLEENNPCLKEHKASLNCLDKNGYDKDACSDYFANYRACMGFWNRVKSDRRRNGITPEMPPLDQRDAIRREHFGK
uniref:Coiled-coil-helix-coiled-coil-helix domain-containing protein 7 n=1 Tax=Graphocephala atropunctata TaxID=36148 RepID=A0A1B6M6U7_9HEMI